MLPILSWCLCVSSIVMSGAQRDAHAADSDFVPSQPPWHLFSADGLVHLARSMEELDNICDAFDLDKSNIRHLVGLFPGNGHSHHVSFWQNLYDVLYLRREGSAELIPVVGGIGRLGTDHFIKTVANRRDDMPFKPAPLQLRSPPLHHLPAMWANLQRPWHGCMLRAPDGAAAAG